MKIQHSPLMTVTPHHAFLSDIAVLTQAWKKAHEYIRRHNWYADTLELDVSAVMLRELVSDWSAILGNRACRPEMYRPEPIRLVTAPKSAPWRVTAAEWKPVKEDGVRLRPLAHIAIRDQTLAVAAMICLADAVETAQRNPSPPFVPGKLAREVDLARAVSSYGNRLVCRWRERRAGFRWGNAETYRRFYEDYRAFVARAERALRDGAGSGARAVIHVDLSKFYDRIDRRALVGKLRRLAEAHYRESETSDRFFELLGNVFDWRWHPDDIPLLKRYQLADDGVGLPQGLVAAGFFANAYLIEFDRAVRRLFDERQRGRNWVIVDYFRYVDDIRVVVDCDRGPRDVRPDQLKQEVAAELERLLTTTTPGVTLNVGKTDVQIRDALPPVVGVARTMAAVQDVVSGPMDTAAATQVLDLIGGLFPVAERAADVAAAAADVDGGAAVGELARGVDGADDAFFADLFTAKLDVRPDTVERFAANRLLRTLRHLRAMSDDAGVDGLARAALDDRAAEFSKTLLRRWFADPSGVRLLRTAMNLLPLPRAFEFVRDRLWPYLAQVERHVDFTLGQVIDSSAMRSAGWARHACLYVAADLFRAAATETGFVTDPDVLPTAADVDGYRRAVCRFARECVGLGVGVPWFVHKQAVVALAVLDVPEQEGEGEDLPNARYAGARYALLAELLTTRRAVSPDFGPMSTVERVAIAIVAWRLARSPGQRERVIAYAVDATSRDGDLDIVRARELLKLEGGELADAVVGVGRKSPSDAKGQDDPGRAGGWRTLSEVIEAPDNPFRQENAALVLLLRLTEAWRGKHKRRRGGVLTPDRVLVRYADPNAIADPSRGLERTVLNLKITPTPPHPDSRFDLPPWCPV
ncbi:MAG TPA: RNA-directed DNA polymerase, partial [Tepidisphaeraceae bacterium]|nr:RNA-directed DNA polymerase [Tepidisphaeraceae bacterium]